jgi:hypothetical protein
MMPNADGGHEGLAREMLDDCAMDRDERSTMMIGKEL